MAAFKCPKSVDVVAELPRNPTGKMLKKGLRKPYWEGRERRIVEGGMAPSSRWKKSTHVAQKAWQQPWLRPSTFFWGGETHPQRRWPCLLICTRVPITDQ
jgi:hypothetical protein